MLYKNRSGVSIQPTLIATFNRISVSAMKYFKFSACLLLTLLVSLALGMHLPDDDDELLMILEEETKYCNDWAVEIHGGLEMADLIASKHGFINLGQVVN